MMLDLLREFVACHAHKQADELFGLVQFVLARGRTHEEAGKHGLADVHRVQHRRAIAGGAAAAKGGPGSESPARSGATSSAAARWSPARTRRISSVKVMSSGMDRPPLALMLTTDFKSYYMIYAIRHVNCAGPEWDGGR